MILNIKPSAPCFLCISKNEAREILERQFDSEVIPKLAVNREWFYAKQRFFSDFYSDFAKAINGTDISDNKQIDMAVDRFSEVMKNAIVFSAVELKVLPLFLDGNLGIPVIENDVVVDVLLTKRLIPKKNELIQPIKQNVKTYIMHDQRNGYYKIGQSVSPKIRERTLQSEMPLLKMILVCEDNIEKELHFKYAEKRIRGEWFGLTPDDILDIVIDYKFTSPL